MEHDPIKNGECCCKCKNQIELVCHPWNKKFGKGSINDLCGWACLMNGMKNKENKKNAAIFTDNEHGLCEMFQER